MNKYHFYGFFHPYGLQGYDIPIEQEYFVEAISLEQAYFFLAKRLLREYPSWNETISEKQLYSILRKSKSLYCRKVT